MGIKRMDEYPDAGTLTGAEVLPLVRDGSLVNTTIEVLRESTMSGAELAYSQVTAPHVATNTVLANVATSKIPGLSCTVEGKGTPVTVDFYCPSYSHATAGKFGAAYLLINNVRDQYAAGFSSQSGWTVSLGFRRRLILTDGVEYTFEIGILLESAGNGTFTGGATNPISLAVIQN